MRPESGNHRDKFLGIVVSILEAFSRGFRLTGRALGRVDVRWMSAAGLGWLVDSSLCVRLRVSQMTVAVL